MSRSSVSSIFALLAVAAAGCGGKVIFEGGSTGAGGGGGSPVACDTDAECGSDSPCAIGACVDHVCVVAPANEGAPCEDGSTCNKNGTCSNGVCLTTPITCPSFNPCVEALCVEGVGCTEAPANEGLSCDTTDSCILGGFCTGGVCQGGVMEDCTWLDTPCAIGVCMPGAGCISVPAADGTPCEDGKVFCTQGDVCLGGACTGGKTPCAPSPCEQAACDEVSESCFYTPIADGAPCDDGQACTTGDHCQAGICKGTLTSGTTVLFSEDFHDNSKGWQLGPEWQIGPAKASTGGQLGDDPAFDHSASSDNGIAGAVIGGVVSTMIHPFQYLTSPPFNTSQAQGKVTLSYYRWLVSDWDPWMHSTVEVWDGAQWVTLFQTANMSVADTAWTLQTFDITPYQGAKTMIRFGFDVASAGAFAVPSWNIDDIVVQSNNCP